MQDIWRLSATDLASLIKSKKVSAKEAATAGLARLDAVNPKINAVVEFRVSEDELLKRLMDRGRADDTEDVIRNRMKVYRDETAPLLEFYSGELKTVDAVGGMDEVFARALAALGR